MVSTTALFFASTVLLSASALASTVLQELDNIHATVYYDLTNSLCSDTAAGDPFQNDWSETSGISDGIPFCQGQSAKSLKQLGTNRIVAMNANMVIGDPAKWCGKEVQITSADGTVLQLDEGPLFIWDACAACISDQIIDLSAKAFTQLKGGSCAGNNPDGLKVQVLDNNIWEYGSGGDTGVSQSPTSESTTPARSTTTAETTPQVVITSSIASTPSLSSLSITPSISSASSEIVPSATETASSQDIVPTASWTRHHTKTNNRPLASFVVDLAHPSAAETAPLTTSPGVNSISSSVVASVTSSIGSASSATAQSSIDASEGCTYGAWSCDGLVLQVCNYVSIDQLGWQTIETCNTMCQFTVSGSVICE